MVGMLKAAYEYCQKDVREVAADIGNAAKAAALGLGITVGLTVAGPAETAHAELPSSLTTAYTTATGNFTDLFELFLPGMILVSGSLLLWRYGKRFISKL